MAMWHILIDSLIVFINGYQDSVTDPGEIILLTEFKLRNPKNIGKRGNFQTSFTQGHDYIHIYIYINIYIYILGAL